jgi:hypothetical protein
MTYRCEIMAELFKGEGRMQYVVIDDRGQVTINLDTEEPEQFADYAKAEDRARKLAEDVPGEVIKIFALTCEVVAPVGEVQCSRVAADER